MWGDMRSRFHESGNGLKEGAVAGNESSPAFVSVTSDRAWRCRTFHPQKKQELDGDRRLEGFRLFEGNRLRKRGRQWRRMKAGSLSCGSPSLRSGRQTIQHAPDKVHGPSLLFFMLPWATLTAFACPGLCAVARSGACRSEEYILWIFPKGPKAGGHPVLWHQLRRIKPRRRRSPAPRAAPGRPGSAILLQSTRPPCSDPGTVWCCGSPGIRCTRGNADRLRSCG